MCVIAKGNRFLFCSAHPKHVIVMDMLSSLLFYFWVLLDGSIVMTHDSPIVSYVLGIHFLFISPPVG